MVNQSRNVAFIIVVLLVAYLTYAQVKTDNIFKHQIREIQTIRKALHDSVAMVKESTAKRDRELRDLIRRDLELMDTLNATLSRLNRGSQEIDRKIRANKKVIDQLWKEN